MRLIRINNGFGGLEWLHAQGPGFKATANTVAAECGLGERALEDAFSLLSAADLVAAREHLEQERIRPHREARRALPDDVLGGALHRQDAQPLLSGGVFEPRYRPTGPRSRAISSSETSKPRSRSRRASLFFFEPIAPT